MDANSNLTAMNLVELPLLVLCEKASDLPWAIGLMYFFMEPNMRARGVIIFKFILFNNY